MAPPKPIASQSTAKPGSGSAVRATPIGARGERATALAAASAPAARPTGSDPRQTERKELTARHPERPQKRMFARLERGLACHRLPDEEQRGEGAERREDPERLRLQMDRALELRDDVPLRVDADRLSACDALDPGPEGAQIRVAALESDAGELDPRGDPRAVGLVERRRHRDQRKRVLRHESGANPDDAQAEQQPTARGRGISASVVVAGLDDPGQLAWRREPRSQGAPDAQVVELGRRGVDEHLVGPGRIRRPPGEQNRPGCAAVVAAGGRVQLDVVDRHRAAVIGATPERKVDRADGIGHLRQPLDSRKVRLQRVHAALPDPDVDGVGRRLPTRDGAVRAPGARDDGGDSATRETGDQSQNQPGAPTRAQLGAQADPDGGHLTFPP